MDGKLKAAGKPALAAVLPQTQAGWIFSTLATKQSADNVHVRRRFFELAKNAKESAKDGKPKRPFLPIVCMYANHAAPDIFAV